MHINWWTLALQAANFAILVWLLQHFLYRPVLRLVDACRAAIEQQLQAAADAGARADARLAVLAGERSGIATARAAVLKEAAAQAEQVLSARRQEAERQASALLEEARRTLALERRAALEAAERVAFDLGVGVARRLLAEVPESLRAQPWLERVGRHLDALGDTERQALRRSLGAGQPVRVVTAVPLAADAAATWRSRLEHSLGPGVATVFDTDAALIAGAELHFGDSTLRFSLPSAVAALQAELPGAGLSAGAGPS